MTRALARCIAAGVILAACGTGSLDETDPSIRSVSTPLRSAAVKPLEQVYVKGKGAVDVEGDYLPKVVCCENGAAHPEALKAQAVMARTYMFFRFYAENLGTNGKPLTGTTADQAYFCSGSVTDACREAVTATRDQVTAFDDEGVTTHNVAFFVDGARPACLAKKSCVCEKPGPSVVMTPDDHPSGCDCFTFASQGAANPAYVTYNWSRTGADVVGSTIGDPKNESNHGCGSQNIQSCLGYAGWKYHDLLRFHYGQDIELRTTAGAIVEDGGSPEPSTGTPPPEHGPGFLPAKDDGTTADSGCTIARKRGGERFMFALALGLALAATRARRVRRS